MLGCSCWGAKRQAYNERVADLIALFPLEVVLFPETALRLHIFEPRYREMTAECLDQHKVFGVVLAQEKGFARIGCTAEIAEVIQRYDDGRLDILSVGQQRFEVAGVDEERSFLRGDVKLFEDEGAGSTAPQRRRAADLQAELLHLAGQDPGEVALDDPQLSFHLAANVPLDLEFKQTLLGMRSENERLAALVKYYEALLPRLRRGITVHRTASGNGHAVH
jgi:Lon protease-like protein